MHSLRQQSVDVAMVSRSVRRRHPDGCFVTDDARVPETNRLVPADSFNMQAREKIGLCRPNFGG